jgi:hypothetical protein
MLATRKRRDAKAELNRRNQACEVLADTGIRVAKSYRLMEWLLSFSMHFG